MTEHADGEEDSSFGCRQSVWTSYTSRTPAFVAALPSTPASRPRFSLTSSDSCGLSIASEERSAVFTGCDGSFMSSTTTPRPSAALESTSFGNSNVES